MAQILSPTEAHFQLLRQKLEAGELVALPTETVYGLAADARNDAAVMRIYAVKNRPALNPLIAHYPSIEALSLDVQLNETARLLSTLWPGPLTLVLPKTPECRVSQHATAGLSTLAVRIPAHPIARRFLEVCEFPLVAPSANPSGFLSPVNAQHVEKGFGERIDWILDGGEAEKGLESTIVDASTTMPAILRAGSVTAEMIAKVLGKDIGTYKSKEGEAPKAPGMKYRHYAPSCPVRLTTDHPIEREALLSFGSGPVPEGFSVVMNLSPRGDLEEAAANLFKFLHALDSQKVSRIAVMPVPHEGVGIAINERLYKAAER